MNVLVVPSWYKTKSNPNLGSFFFEQSKIINDLGHEVYVANVSFQGIKDYFSGNCYKMKKENREGVKEYSYVVPSFGRFNRDDGGAATFYKNLRRVFQEIKNSDVQIDVIHAHSYRPAGIAAVQLGNEEHIPVVVTEHASDIISNSISNKRITLLRKVIKDSNAFICVSEGLKKSVIKLTGCNEKMIQVIPNTVSSIFSYKTVKKNTDFTFITIGNLIQSKRMDLTIEAFQMLAENYGNIQLYIVGDGPLKEKLKSKVNMSGLSNRVYFLGRLDRKNVYKMLLKSSCFVLPSDYETFGVVYIEALATGLPVIGTKNGGAEDIINKTNGILVEKDNIVQLKKAMLDIYKNYSAYDKKKLSQIAIDMYGSKAVGKRLESIYSDVLNRNVVTDII